MSLSMHQVSIPVFVRGLQALSGLLQKGAAHAAETGVAEGKLITAQLAPDMLNLAGQVQRASDTSKLSGQRLSGVASPPMPDTETTFAELDARLQRAIDYLLSVPAAAFEGAEDRAVTMPTRANGDLHFDGRGYLLSFVVPNVYFHCTIAYALLRHAGVPLGKMDYVGPIGQR